MTFADYMMLEMAFNSKEAEARMSASMNSFIDHILKIQYARNRSQNHWERELISFIRNFDSWARVKTKSKRISYKRLKNGLLDYCSPNCIKSSVFALKSYNLVELDIKEVSRWVTKLFKDLFFDISQNTCDVETYLNRILDGISPKILNS